MRAGAQGIGDSAPTESISERPAPERMPRDRPPIRPTRDEDGVPLIDAASAAAFAELIAAYRAIPALRVRTTTTIGASDGDVAAESRSVDAELLHAIVDGRRRGLLSVRGFTIWLGGGEVAAIHESNEGAYFAEGDGGAPLTALLRSFRSLPFPDLALAFGASDPAGVLRELHPQAPDVLPVAVEEEVVEGRAVRVLRLASDRQSIDLVVDPETGLLDSMTAIAEGAGGSAAGTRIRSDHSFEYFRPEEAPDAATFAFDPGLRTMVDLMAALPKQAAVRTAAQGRQRIGADGLPVHPLLDAEVPALFLPLLDGGALDLGTARGKVLVLDFWATWCGPCKAAMPGLHEVAALFRAEGAPVEVYAVNVFEQETDPVKRRDLVRRFWTSQKYTLPVALDERSEAGGLFHIAGIPTIFVVRADGLVHAVLVGGGGKQRLIDAIRGAIAAPGEPGAPGAPRAPEAPQPAGT